MKNKFVSIMVILGLAVILPLVVSACGSRASAAPFARTFATPPVRSVETPVTGSLAPDFTGVDVVTGKTITLSQYKGQKVLLNFVNYGCNPELNKIVGNQLLGIKSLMAQRTDFVPVSVFCGCCTPEQLRQFATQNDLNWPWLLDTDYSIINQYDIWIQQFGYPTLLLIDKDGKIQEVIGYTSAADLNTKLDKLQVISQ